MAERLRAMGAYCYIWLMVGFFTGTLLLVGPVRLLTAAVQARGWSDSEENLLMLGVIALFVLTSAAIAWWLYRRVAACRTRRTRWAIPLGVTAAAVACLWAWMNPTLLAQYAGGAGGHVAVGGARGGPVFVFGPYPDRARLEQLKREGYTAVISLQHPAVLPFEPPGIAEEQKAAADIGLEFIHAPMLPWVSANEDSLDQIRQLAHKGSGRYYVHCGLGRDRANVVKRMLEREGTRVAAGEGFEAPRTLDERLAEGEQFERGAIREVAPDVWLIPYPNKHELFGHILAGQVKHVVMLLDPNDPTQAAWLDEGTRLLQQFGIAFSSSPLAPDDSPRADAIATRVKSLPRPLVIVAPFTAPKKPSGVADAFVAALEKSGSS